MSEMLNTDQWKAKAAGLSLQNKAFIGGRYALTVTTRNVRDSGTRVKVTTRVEGYISEEYGYQELRSRGIIEDREFAAIGESVGAAPAEAN